MKSFALFLKQEILQKPLIICKFTVFLIFLKVITLTLIQLGTFNSFSLGVISKLLAGLTSGALLWFCLVQLFRLSLKWFLSYKGWMYENPHATGKISAPTQLWFVS